jgi:DNA polymerase phi
LLFQEVIQQPDKFSKIFPSLFSRNFTRSLVNHLRSKDRYLHAAAARSLKLVNEIVDAEPSTLSVVLSGLLRASYHFDKATKTKTVEELLSRLNETNAKSVIDALVQGAVLVERYGSSHSQHP